MMKRDIKMIGLDLDGTLLNSDKVFSDYSKQVIAEAIRQGVIVLPATGRPATGIPREVREFPGIRYAVTANGARVLDMKENKVLYERLVAYEDGKRLLEIFGKYDTLMEIYYEGVGYANAEGLRQVERFVPVAPMAKYITGSRRAVEDLHELICREQRPVDKVHALFADLDERKAALAEAKEQLPHMEYTSAIANNLEVNAEGARKGIGLLKLGEVLGISREEIMACGDGSNDLDMIREVGFGVAMANAIDPIKQAADYVTVSNDEDGVAKAIEKYVLKSPKKIKESSYVRFY